MSYSRILLVALALGCVSASEEVAESTSDVVAPDEGAVAVPDHVARAALGVRSSLLLTQDERLLRESAQELGWVERAWFGAERRACLQAPHQGADAPWKRCLALLDELRARLLLEPPFAERYLPDGTPTVAFRMFDHAQLEALRAAIPMDLLREELGEVLAASPESFRPERASELLDAYGNGLISLQERRILELSRALRFLPDDEATGLALGEAVSGWLWLQAASVDETALDE